MMPEIVRGIEQKKEFLDTQSNIRGLAQKIKTPFYP